MKHVPAYSYGQGFGKTAGDVHKKLHKPLRMPNDAFAPQQQAERSKPYASAAEQQVRLVLKARRSRAQFFDGQLFADPAWDMLLELYAAELGQRRMSVSSLCIGAAVPATTALRWIRTLEQKGLLVRTPDRYDARRVLVSLSQTGVSSMAAYFEHLSAKTVW